MKDVIGQEVEFGDSCLFFAEDAVEVGKFDKFDLASVGVSVLAFARNGEILPDFFALIWDDEKEQWG